MVGGRNMSFRFQSVRLQVETARVVDSKPSLLSPGLWNFVRLFAVVLTAAVLAACAEFSVVTNKAALRGVNRQTSLAAVSTKRYFPHSTHARVTGTRAAEPYGLASFYSEGPETASGEKFGANELTAAHPKLPFGTRLRVTNLANGRSVTVRINDRGPFVAGRSADVSYSAAKRMVAKVRMDVV